MIDHELTDPTGSALTITHNVDGVWVTATDTRDEVTVGPFPARTLRASFDMGDDLMDGGVTAAAIEAEVDGKAMWEKTRTDHLSPERARSLVQERDEALTYAAETIATAQAETTAAVTRAEKAEQELEQSRRGYGALMDKLATTARQRDEADKRAATASPRPLTAREHLDAAWEAAHVVPAGTAIAPGVGYITRYEGSGEILASVEGHSAILPTRGIWGERRLLDPEPPSRPEGAEGLAEVLRTFPGTLAGIRDISDHLASHGIRAGGDS